MKKIEEKCLHFVLRYYKFKGFDTNKAVWRFEHRLKESLEKQLELDFEKRIERRLRQQLEPHMEQHLKPCLERRLVKRFKSQLEKRFEQRLERRLCKQFKHSTERRYKNLFMNKSIQMCIQMLVVQIA